MPGTVVVEWDTELGGDSNTVLIPAERFAERELIETISIRRRGIETPEARVEGSAEQILPGSGRRKPVEGSGAKDEPIGEHGCDMDAMHRGIRGARYIRSPVRLGLHAVSAKLGGAATYLKRLMPALVRTLDERRLLDRLIVWHSGLLSGRESWAPRADLRGVSKAGPLLPTTNTLGRLWFDQVVVPREARAARLDAVFATANFCSLRPACAQVLLVRNTVPFDDAYIRRVPRRSRAILFLQRQLTLRSMAIADIVLFPSVTMMEFAARAVGGERPHWRVARYGVDIERFAADPDGVRRNGPVRVLNVSTYSDQKNLGTLMQAMSLLTRRAPGEYTLRVTAGFSQRWIGDSPLFPSFRDDARAFDALAAAGVADEVPWMSHDEVPALYASSDIFVFPSYTESFGHPLVEAMAAGLPIVAADTPINREMCGDAAVYVPAFDADAYAEMILRLARAPTERLRLGVLGRARATQFRWSDHAEAVTAALQDAAAGATR
jgi:glycosyltransferase involved in cell wall biosynthesis